MFKNNLHGFVSQAWEMVLDAWDQRLKSAGTRHLNEWELAGIVASAAATDPNIPSQNQYS